MGDLSSLFMFKSKEQREKEQRQYRDKMFPLGLEETRPLVCAAIKPAYSARRRDEETVFMYLVAKQAYLESEFDIETALYSLKKASYKPSEAELKSIAALLTLEKDVTSLDDYPTPEQVGAAAQNISV